MDPVTIASIVGVGAKLIDKLWPNKADAEAAKVKLVELAQAGELEELRQYVEQLRIEAEDRASARAREAQTGDSATPRALAAIFTVGFFGVLGWLLAAGAPQHGSEALLVLLGALSAGQAAILSYYFGSSSSSRAKNETISRLVEPRQ